MSGFLQGSSSMDPTKSTIRWVQPWTCARKMRRTKSITPNLPSLSVFLWGSSPRWCLLTLLIPVCFWYLTWTKLSPQLYPELQERGHTFSTSSGKVTISATFDRNYYLLGTDNKIIIKLVLLLSWQGQRNSKLINCLNRELKMIPRRRKWPKSTWHCFMVLNLKRRGRGRTESRLRPSIGPECMAKYPLLGTLYPSMRPGISCSKKLYCFPI